jgi:ABC-type nitrate/sulfonate/bicarbonate transport system ATPase subunit
MAFLEVRDLSKSFPSPAGVRTSSGTCGWTSIRASSSRSSAAMGSGKSTLLSLLAGLTSPDAGTVVLDGKPVTGVRGDGRVRIQNYSLLPWFSALENVRLAVQAAFRRPRRRAETPCHRRARTRRARQRPRPQASPAVGRHAAACVAGARVRHGAAVLFLDEPFGALDALTRDSAASRTWRSCAPSASGRSRQ